MEVTGVRCNHCGDFIYSRARHDFHSCSCGSISVDGGFDYLRVLGKGGVDYEVEKHDVAATKKELYDDWNTQTNKYGWVKHEPE